MSSLQFGVIACDEKHVVFDSYALQVLRNEYASLFSDVCTMK